MASFKNHLIEEQIQKATTEKSLAVDIILSLINDNYFCENMGSFSELLSKLFEDNAFLDQAKKQIATPEGKKNIALRLYTKLENMVNKGDKAGTKTIADMIKSLNIDVEVRRIDNGDLIAKASKMMGM